MQPISSEKKQAIIFYLQQDLSMRKVAEICQVSKSTISNVKKSHLPTLISSKGGNKYKLSPQDKRWCIRAVTSGKVETATKAANKLKEELNVSVSRQTVARALKEAGMNSVEKKKRPKLSTKNIKNRLAFAKCHKDWTVDDWKRVIWSDETKINRFCSDGRSWYWKHDNTRLQTHHVKETVKHGGGSVMVWGCMTSNGVGFLCKIDDIMNQELYKAILQDELLSTI